MAKGFEWKALARGLWRDRVSLAMVLLFLWVVLRPVHPCTWPAALPHPAVQHAP
jgi:hypothetical protein